MTRRFKQFVVTLIAILMVVAGLTAGVAASTNIDLPSWGEGDDHGLRAGPLGINPRPQGTSVPVSINIPDADVDAEVERNRIVDGVMLDPSGPWVVSWYQETAQLGEIDNIVMSGHVDYWDVGPAVFWTVGDLAEQARMNVRGDDGAVYTYAVEWVRTYEVAGLTPETISEIVGKTDYRALTLITCGGDFNYDTGEYLSRTIIRGRLVEASGIPVQEASAPGDTEGADESEVETLEASADETDGGDGVLEVGGTAVVTDDGVNMRAAASTDADIVTRLAEGQEVSIIGGPEDGSGFTWWQVEVSDGTEGWVAEDFLDP
jgi:sortase (surface protein transpeptidase)